MIRIRLDGPALASTRLAISPLHELVGALHLLTRCPRDVPWPYTDWAGRARAALHHDPRLQIYGAMYGREHARTTPDVFTPRPPSAGPSIADELEALRATPPATVREQLAKHYPEGVPPFLMPYREDPTAALATALDAFWQTAMAPYWPAMRTALDEELLARSRSLATAGAGTVLGELRGRVRWEPPMLGLVKPAESAVDATGRRLLLVPVLFAQEVLTCSTDDPGVLMVTYQARGAGVLATRRAGPPSRSPLTLLAGSARAAVLQALAEPATTTGLARRLNLAPSTLSEHLTTLREAGLVQRHRTGPSVLHTLTPTALALLTLLEPTTSDGPPPAPPAR